MRFGILEMDPAVNPAVLDTATWDHRRAWALLTAAPAAYWEELRTAGLAGNRLPSTPGAAFHDVSCTQWRGSLFCLATLTDGQQVLVELGDGRGALVLGPPLGSVHLDRRAPAQMLAYPASVHTIPGYVRAINPDRAPRAMGDRPRLGLGSRMTTASWPGVYRAIAELSVAANAIQNSMREVSILGDLLAGRPGEPNYGPNLGTFASGHTGSSFEGLWLYGVLEALKAQGPIAYGAEADHIQIKRGPGGLDGARRVLDSAPHYTFFTLDASDILHYHAIAAGPQEAMGLLEHVVPSAGARRDLLAYHQQPHQLESRTLRLDDVAVARLFAKHCDALGSVEDLACHIGDMKVDQPYDLELAIDEVPAGLTACECITSTEELLFVVRECRRRGIRLSHVAPNVGVEKEIDYRCAGGLTGLETRVREQTQLARELGVMLDFHSGDDLTRETRRAIGRATAGHCHFKLSPSLQLVYAETLDAICPDKFQIWWDDTLAFARREAAVGSPLAQAGLRLLAADGDQHPSARHQVFRHYCFASVGRRDEFGQYVLREMFYDLPAAFYAEYSDRLRVLVAQIADDLFGQV